MFTYKLYLIYLTLYIIVHMFFLPFYSRYFNICMCLFLLLYNMSIKLKEKKQNNFFFFYNVEELILLKINKFEMESRQTLF